MFKRGVQAPGEELLGGALSEDLGDELAKHPARIERYSKARARALDILAYLEQVPHLERERVLLRDCGNWLLFRRYYTVGKVRLSGMHSCSKPLLCPLCAIRRGAKALKVYLERFKVISSQVPELRPYLVTFTVANGPNLGERMRHLQWALKTLQTRRRLFVAGGKRAVWTEAVRAWGAVWSYEVTNRGKGWHPHAHAIWLCESPPDRWALVEEWKRITGDSCILDVRPMHQTDLAKDFCEVFKYTMKFGELANDHLVEAYRTLRGKRLIGSFGCFRGVQVPEELTDDLLDDLPYIELLYRFQPGTGYSVQASSDPLFDGQPLEVTA